MSEHPLLFTSEMAKAVLDGRKTQTRRIPVGRYLNWKVGDTIWVKEDYKYIIQGDMVIVYYKYSINENRVEYTPLNCFPEITRKKLNKAKQGVWKSKLLMFKFMARIFLGITNIRVEKVRSISETDCIAEGITIFGSSAMGHIFTAKEHFKGLWDSINAARGYGWSENPVVKVIEFKRINNGTNHTRSDIAK